MGQSNSAWPQDRGSVLMSWRSGRRLLSSLAIAIAAIVTITPALAQLEPSANFTPPPEEQRGVETLTQGPIHEAFANPSDLDPTPGPVVARQPPADIAEEPPEFMPEDSVWISGYWIWDDERDDFIWVTGVARKVPPGMRYVPGYWIELDGGFQRVSGFWASADAGELEYREPPPNTLETGPSSPAPSQDHFWVPGNWNHYDTGYRWRAGYWTPYQQDWVWCPARWVWTPGGCVYLSGFWDYRLSHRGTMFAPVYFTEPIYTQPNWSYRPWCTIPTSNLFIHLWVRPNYSHYYFGNYYGPRHANLGFHSWCHYPTRRYHYDPFFTYCNVHYRRQGVDFVGRVRGWHDHYDRHEDRRPPRTWREQQHLVAQRDNRISVETQLVAHNIADVARRDDTPIKLARVDDRKRQAMAERTEKFRELNTARKQVEREAAKVAVQLPRDGRPGRDDDQRGPGRGKADDRDVLPGKAKGDDRDIVPGKAKGDDRDITPGKGKGRDDVPGKGKADDVPAKGKADAGDKREKGDRGDKADRLPDGAKAPQDGAKAPQDGAKGRGGPAPKLKLPQDPDAKGRPSGPRPGADKGGKAGGQRDNIPPPMPQADGKGRPKLDRVPGDRGTGDRAPGEGVKRGPEDRPGPGDARGPDRGGKSDAPRPSPPRTTPGDLPPGGLPKDRPKADEPKAGGPKGGAPKGGPAKGDVPRISPPGDRPRGDLPKGGAPKLDSPPPGLPKGTGSKADAPRVEPPRGSRPSFEVPKADRPRADDRPRLEDRPQSGSKRVEIPNVERPRETPRVQPPPRAEPKAEPRREPAPRSEAPKAPKSSAPRPEPRAEAPRPAPRVDVPKAGPRSDAPRAESPRVMPRIEAPRPAPRVEAPRPAPQREAPRPAPRVEAPRPAPRAEAPRPAPQREAPRIQPQPRSEPPRAPRASAPPPRAEAPRNERPGGSDSPSAAENRGRGKGKNKD
jgi:hypothetical protein